MRIWLDGHYRQIREVEPLGGIPLGAARLVSQGELERAQERRELRLVITSALKTLNPRTRAIVVLRFGLDGNGERSLDETATIFGISRGAVKSAQYRAMGILRYCPSLRARGGYD